VTAVFSVHGQLDIRADKFNLHQHDQVVTTLMGAYTVAPARFGSVLANADRLGEVLATQAPRLAPVLARLRGTAELAVRATLSHPEDFNAAAQADPPTRVMEGGLAYLVARRQASGPPMALPSPLVRLHSQLANRARCWTVGAGPDDSLVGAYLVSTTGVDAFRDELLAARARDPHLRISLTGPWAPYSFVEPEAAGDG
jgi:hypothetical protein